MSLQCGSPPPSPKPGAPSNVSSIAGNSYITITWGASSGTVTGYRIYSYRTGATYQVSSSTYSYTDTGLINGISYEYDVYAYNLGGNSSGVLTTSVPYGPPIAPVISYVGVSAVNQTSGPTYTINLDSTYGGTSNGCVTLTTCDITYYWTYTEQGYSNNVVTQGHLTAIGGTATLNLTIPAEWYGINYT